MTKVMLSEEEFVGTLQRTAASLRKEHVETELVVRIQLQELLLFPSEQMLLSLKQAGFVHPVYAVAVIRTALPLQEAWSEELFGHEEGDQERRYLPVRMTPDTWCLYFYSTQRENDASFYGWYSRQCSRIEEKLHSSPGFGDYVVAAGAVYHRPCELPRAYQQGLALCDRGFYAPSREIVREEEAVGFTCFPQERFRVLLAEMGNAARQVDGPQAGILLREWGDQIGTTFRPAPG
ncbi:hypothetical protein K0U00_43915, partial [Paenibacillus sepulcri]|nr:hypothetical protein [Paenibacillus sepulcri]